VVVFIAIGLGSIGLRSGMMEEDNDVEFNLSANQ
jgi:hypothetical protein